MTGTFISIEGVDGAGTTTQAQSVADELLRQNGDLTGDDILITAEPTDREIGRLIRTGLAGDIELSQQALALLFAADRVDHINKTVQPALNDGKVVISDRYYLSSYAYQQEAGSPLSWLQTINKHALTPDLTVYLDVDIDECFNRMDERDSTDIFEQREFLSEIQANYIDTIETLDRQGEAITAIDGNLSEETVTEAITDAIANELTISV